MNKLKMHSPDLTQANIDKLAELFPNCVAEAAGAHGVVKRSIDFDQLRQELSGSIVEGPQERYQLNWPGKREALLTANAPIAKTLRPCREESVDFDTTQNLFIEGDNLDALKLLQETYLNKVKMIYIDPPYNTGNDFIYEDDFAENSQSYLDRSNQKDDVGNRMIANTESNGRFHSDWLSMIYPRLRLARNLLSEDGVIFISIDDNEAPGLRGICDEIFGAENFLAQIIWQKMYSGKADATHFGRFHEYVICYARQFAQAEILLLPRTAEMNARYTNPDADPRGDWLSNDLTAAGERGQGHYDVTSPSGKVFDSPPGKHWLYSQERMKQLIRDNRIFFGKNGDAYPRLKRFLTDVQQGRRANTIWLHDEVGHTDEGTKELKKLFEAATDFQAPKPSRLIQQMLRLATKGDQQNIVLDFFAGSGTTAHAVMALNAEDSGSRRFILVQMPEKVGESAETYKAGYSTISDFSKDRIRRISARIKKDSADKLGGDRLDLGFRVLKIDTSNMKEVFYTPDTVSQDLLSDQVNNIREDRTAEDLLFQVLLDWGVDLALPISKEAIAGKTVYFVDGNALAACFDEGVNEDFVKLLAKREPLRVVFRDAGFASDSVKINVEQIFKLMSPSTEVKTI
jgi:adenine-specific DNA-methyltransferase